MTVIQDSTGTPSNRLQSNLRKHFLAYRELCTFSFFILVIDNASKYLLLSSLRSLNAGLGNDWLATLVVQTIGLGILGWLLWHIARPSSNVLIVIFIFIAVIVVVSPIISSFQDFSSDGQSYHLQRVAMFPVDWNIGSLLLANRGGYAITFPLLPDNIRGIQITLLGSGPFSGVAINIAIACCSIYFWVRYCSFLPPARRFIAALSPVAASQLFTYYIDGFIAVFGGMLLLACMLPSALADYADDAVVPTTEEADRRHMQRLISLTLAMSLFVFAQSKYSFIFLFTTFSLPLAVHLVLGSIASGSRRFLPAVPKIGGLAGACALTILAALILFNPYFLIVKSLVSQVDYSYFLPSTFKEQADTVFGEAGFPGPIQQTPRMFRFIRSDILSVWPGGADLIDTDVRSSVFGLVKRLIARLGTEDARFSGYGALSVIVLLYAFGVAVYAISIFVYSSAKISTKPHACRFGENVTVSYVLSGTYIIQLILSLIYPLGWWARMNPAVYFTASCIALFGVYHSKVDIEHNIRDVRSRLSMVACRSTNLVCLCIITVSMVVPPFVHLLRSQERMRDFDAATQSLRDRVATSEEKTVLFPIDSDSRWKNQLSAATKILQVSHGQRFSVKIVRPEVCDGVILKSETHPEFWYCLE